jgi:hypothetical protein
MVLEVLQAGEALTSLDAFRRFGITRLASVIHRLRREYDIDSPTIAVPNRRGQKCRVACYKYVGKITRLDA